MTSRTTTFGRTMGGSNVRMTAGGTPLQIQDRPVAETYNRGGQFSFFGDMLTAATRQDRDAVERLNANQAAQNRAVTTVTGAGGQFAPPQWLVEDYIALARPGRVTADLFNKSELPQGQSSINLPKVASGTTVGVTATQNTQISNTDITTTSVSSGITTISGEQVISLEMMYQGGTRMDQVILSDLALASAQKLETQVLSGAGTGGELRGLDNAGGTAVAFTTTTPALTSTTAANSFYQALVKATNSISTGRFLPANAIVCHPRRWAWVSTQLDTTNRPIVPASGAGGSYNSAGSIESVAASGRVGTLAGLPVYTSASITTTAGAGTNQDVVYVLRTDDMYLWESPLQLETFAATYANQNALLVRALEFAACIPDRYVKSISTIGGTGLVDPGLG
jgi:HK97 family phage major capsid protein